MKKQGRLILITAPMALVLSLHRIVRADALKVGFSLSSLMWHCPSQSDHGWAGDSGRIHQQSQMKKGSESGLASSW